MVNDEERPESGEVTSHGRPFFCSCPVAGPKRTRTCIGTPRIEANLSTFVELRSTISISMSSIPAPNGSEQTYVGQAQDTVDNLADKDADSVDSDVRYMAYGARLRTALRAATRYVAYVRSRSHHSAVVILAMPITHF